MPDHRVPTTTRLIIVLAILAGASLGCAGAHLITAIAQHLAR
jgi:ABC-type Fe3+-siderophore transport system permease subunit